MKWNSMGLFASPLIKIEIENTAIVTDFFDDNIVSSEREGLLRHYHSTQNVFELYRELEGLKKSLESAGTFAYRELLNYKKSGEMKITNAWFNQCQVGGSQQKHSHANSLLSGTLYLRTDQNTNIAFYHPLTTDSLHAELFDEPDSSANAYGLNYHIKEVVVKVAQGECLFWPSQLRHGYVNNQTPKRLSLSFNMMPQVLNTTYQVI